LGTEGPASMTRLMAERGERQEARDRLTAIYADFTEGFGTPDLQDAKALLDQLI
jgi:predicted ATPase